MIVCDREFDQRDPKDSDISLVEVDFYAGILPNPAVRDHRLSLRKRFFAPGFGPAMFELYRHFHDTGEEIAIERSVNLARILRRAHCEFERFHGRSAPDRVCTHLPPWRAFTCPVPASEALAITGMEVSTHTINQTDKE
jgi:hypothetical protein